MGTKSDRKHDRNGSGDGGSGGSADAPEDVERPTGRGHGHHVPGPRRRGRVVRYATVMAVYTAGVAGAAAEVRRRGITPTPPSWGDIALIGLATHKLSRIVTKEVVTTPLRAPFTEVTGHGGPAEVNERPVGDGWRHSVGELLSCPFCLGVWIATGLTAGTYLAPAATRAAASAAGAVAVSDFLQLGYTIAQQHAE